MNSVYSASLTEYVDGQTLIQWMRDNPRLDLERVRGGGVIEQIAKGLHAFHRLEMLHQDLRPEKIMIDNTGTVKIIGFGSTKVAGINRSESIGSIKYILASNYYSEVLS